MSVPQARGHRVTGPLSRPDFARHYEWVVAGVTVVAAGLSAYSQYQQGQQAEAAGKYNARVAQNQAVAAQQAAGLRADQLRDRARRIESTNIARAASGGIVPTAGSPLFVMAENAMQAELDAQRVQYGGDVEAAGFESQARLARWGAGRASEAGAYRAGSTLLSGAASAMRRYRGGGGGGVDPSAVQEP